MTHVHSVNIGRPALVHRHGVSYQTTFYRTPVAGRVPAGHLGLEGDEVRDTRNHGGPDQAICAYPHEHYAECTRRFGRELDVPSFGENLTTVEWDEREVCIGDTYRIGTTVVQVSQPRRPCATLARAHGAADLPAWVFETGYSGFYLRVLEEGELAAGDPIVRLERPHPQWSVERMMRVRSQPREHRDELVEAAELAALSPKWRSKLTRLRAVLRDDSSPGR
jgi:MOSC domain-containing protein YiiM